MRVTFGQGVTPMASQVHELHTARLPAHQEAQIPLRAFESPMGAGEVEPNRECGGPWMRFASSVALLARQDTPMSNAPALPGSSIRDAAREEAAKAGPQVDAPSAARDLWQVIEQVSALELGGAVNASRHRAMAESGSAILERVSQQGDGARSVPTGNEDLIHAVEHWIAVTGVRDGATEALSQPESAPGEASATSKTLAASWKATSPGGEVLRIDLSRVAGKYIGETEKNLGTVFSNAERIETAILFDETDALFGRRTDTPPADPEA